MQLPSSAITRRPRYQQPGAPGSAIGRNTRSARRRIACAPSRVRACEIAPLVASNASAPPLSHCKLWHTTRSTSSIGASRHNASTYKRFVGMFVKAGGKVMTGNDTSYSGWAVAGAGIHHELELLVDAGLTPMQAIMAATRNPAAGYRALDKVGTVERDKFADLVIVDADPLVDIRNIHRISTVIKDGQVRNLSYHRWFADPFDGEDLEAPEWYRSLKQLSEVEGIRTLAGLTDPTSAFGQPCPGIESLSPLARPEGSPAFSLTIKGINFTTRSTVRWGPREVPVKWISETELQATIDPTMTARAGFFPIEVSNPGPNLSQPKWGSTSNRARFIVGLAP